MRLEPYPDLIDRNSLGGYKATDGSSLVFHKGESNRLLSVFVSGDGETLPHHDPICPSATWEKIPFPKAAPTHILVNVLQCSPSGTTSYVNLEDLTHIRTVNGVIRKRNPDDRRGVDIRSHVYSLYFFRDYVHPVAVVAVSHGGGIHLYMVQHCFFDQTMAHLADTLEDEKFWDVCDVIVKSYEQGKEHGTYTAKVPKKRTGILR